MFTIIACLAVSVLAWYAQRREAKERSVPDPKIDDDFVRQRVVYIREDVRLIAYLLMAIFVMLGVIADRLH
jgi:hypothetical protein